MHRLPSIAIIIILITAVLYSCKNPTMPMEPDREPNWQMELELIVDGTPLASDSTNTITAGTPFTAKITLFVLTETQDTIYVKDEMVDIRLSKEGQFIEIDDENINNVNIESKQTNEKGVVEFGNLIIVNAEDYALEVNSAILSKPSKPFKIVPAEAFADSSEFVELPDTVTVNDSLVFRIQLKDKYGNIRNNDSDVVTVSIQRKTNGPSGADTISTTYQNGVFASNSYKFTKTTEYYVDIIVNGNGFSQGRNLESIKVVPPDDIPSQLRIESQPVDATAGQKLVSNDNGNIALVVLNARGQGLVDVKVTAELIPEQQSTTTFADQSTVSVTTDEDGRAVFENLIVNRSGRYRIKFRVPENIEAQSDAFTVDSADPSNVKITTQPSNSDTGVVIDDPPTVQVRDEFGNFSRNVEITAELVLEDGESSIRFADGSTVTVRTGADGKAVFNNLIVSESGTYRIRFKVGVNITITSDIFEVTESDEDGESEDENGEDDNDGD